MSDDGGSSINVGEYAAVNGLQLYYELTGTGRPLVLLHGGLQTIDLTFGPLIPTLAQDHQVIGIELQGHGHTADIERPMRLVHLADDVAAVLGLLGIEESDVFGFSLGGMVGVELALRHPHLVGRLVVASVDVRPDHAEFERPDDPDVARRMPTESDFQAMRDAYAAVAPDPEHFPAIAAKTSGMVGAFAGWSDDELRRIGAPTLVLLGDTDFVPLRHAVEMFELIPHAQLAVLPDTTHVEVTRRPQQVLALIRPFLEPAS
jgi:pimeloyl-ACP methyl ester carboxylesterase